jgi:CheY-like chemotaxis protein
MARRTEAEATRVIVVDDDAEQRAALVAFLSSAGVTVQPAATAFEARAIFRSFAPQVMISDISMPIEDGYDLVRSIRGLPGGSPNHLFAIAITGVGDEKTPGRAFAAGFDRLLAKPVNLTALLRAVLADSRWRT